MPPSSHRSATRCAAQLAQAAASVIALTFAAGCGGGEDRPPAGAEACLGSLPALGGDHAALGLPAEPPDLQAWVLREQSGLLQITTRPCDAKPKGRMMRVPSDAQIVRRGASGDSPAALAPGQKISVWYAGGSRGTARAVLIEHAVPWPPASR